MPLPVERPLVPAATAREGELTRGTSHCNDFPRIAPGRLAHLVIQAADPTADIRNTRKIERVIRGGRVCEPQALLREVPKH